MPDRGRTPVLLMVLVGVACSGMRPGAGNASVPERVLSLVPSATEIILELGEGHRLVGRTRFDNDSTLQHLPSIGGSMDASTEQIVRLHPDLLVGWASEGPEARERYAALGLNIRLVGTQTITDFRDAVDSLGHWLRVPARADSLIRAVDESLAIVRANGARRKPVSVFYAIWIDPPTTVGRNTFIGDLITVTGARNIFDDAPIDWPTVSLETVVRRNPDVVIWPRTRDIPSWPAALAAHPEWKKVRAVRTGRVLELDGDLFNRPGPRLSHAARVLSDALDSIARLPVVR